MSRQALKHLDIPLSFFLLPIALVLLVIRNMLVRKEADKRLIVRPGGMGDLILLTLALEINDPDYRNRYCFVIEERSEPWARFLKLNYSLYTDPGTLWKLGRFDRVFNSEQRFGLASVYSLIFSGSILFWKNQVHFDTNRLSVLGRRIKYDPLETHETRSFSELVFRRGIGDFRTLRQESSNGRYLFFLGGTFSKGRNLSEADWATLLDEWYPDQAISAITSPAEKEKLKSILKKAKRSVEVIEVSNFDQTIDIVKRSERVLTIDSGALHLCSYFGVSVDAVFTNGIFMKWKNLSRDSHILKNDLSCQPCVRFGQEPTCPIDFKCKNLKGLLWKDV